MTPGAIARFWLQVEKCDDGCWRWRRQLDKDGYGRFCIGGRKRSAHKFAYELTRGPVPAGLELDHTCRTRGCRNPDHLEAVTHRENVRRGSNAWHGTHCARGHELTPENVYSRPSGRRQCLRCKRLASLASAAKRMGVL